MQRELDYRLSEEDYRDWIHWSLSENPRNNRKIMAIGLFLALTIFVMSGGIRASQGDFSKLLPNIAIVLIAGGILLMGMSQKHQEKLIWKRSGLERLKMRDEFPTVHLTANETSLRIDAQTASGEQHTSFSYKEIFEIRETPQLILLRTLKAWQFVAKSAFADEADKDEFVRFLQEKIEDAAAHPENYPTEKEAAEKARAEEAEREAEERRAETGSGGLPAEPEDTSPAITRVDTSRMGTIGKLAHMVTSDVEKTAEEPKAEPAEEPGETPAKEPAEDMEKF